LHTLRIDRAEPATERSEDPDDAKETPMSEHSRINRSGMNVEDNRAILRQYWKRNIRFTLILLGVWFLAGYIVAILLAPLLNRVSFLGGPLGFWFAQNGAIYVFWSIILVYALGMNRLDREFDVEE